MIRNHVAAIAIATATLSSALAGDASPTMNVTIGNLTLSQPWTRATPTGAKAGGGYVSITNNGAVPDRLVAVATPIAAKAEIHQMKMDGGTMIMRPLTDGLSIPAGETVDLKPGGYHLMFMGLNSAIREGASVPVTLTFDGAGNVDVMLIVAPIGAKPPPIGDHGNHGGG